jgi:hypothetical protein
LTGENLTLTTNSTEKLICAEKNPFDAVDTSNALFQMLVK